MLARMKKSILRLLIAPVFAGLMLTATAAPNHAPAQHRAVSSPASPPVQAPDLRGTPDHPILIAMEADKNKESDDHTLATWTVWLGIATIALAIVGFIQVVLVVLQLRLMSQGGKDTRLAADAAKQAALAADKSASVAEKALYDTERPFVKAEVPVPGLTVLPGDMNGPRLKREDLVISINNYGRTPAILTELQYTLEIRASGVDIAPIDPNNMRGRSLPAGVLAVPEKPFEERTNLRLWEMAFKDGIANNTHAVWMLGFVRYKDVFGKQFVSGFALVFDPFGGVFVKRGDQLRNYTREEGQILDA